MTSGKTIALTRWTCVGKVMSLFLNMLSRLVITFLPRSKRSFNFMATVTIYSDFGAQNVKSATASTVSPSICHEMVGPDAMILVFWMLCFKPTSSLSSFTFWKWGSLVLLYFLPLGWWHLHIWGYWYFSQQSWFQFVLLPAQRFSWCTLHISQISRVTIHSLDIHLILFGTSLLFHVQFWLLLPDLNTDFSRGRSSGLVFPSLEEFSTVYCDPHSQRLWHFQ